MDLSPRTLQTLGRLIHDWTGVVIGADKSYLVKHRLEPLLSSFGMADFDALVRALEIAGPNSRLHERVVDAITTGETSFFRDTWFFDTLAKTVLPERVEALTRDRARRHRVRIWSAGSSTGQEAYSLAMLVRELIDASGGAVQEHHFTIVASDISAEAIRSAAAGRYTKAEVARGLVLPRLERHFARDGAAWVAGEPLRRLVQFRRLNLLKFPADLGMFDLVLCRNVMIYFDEETRKRVCASLRGVLHEGAWLGVGAAESLHGHDRGLDSVKLARAVFYRRRQPSSSGE